MKPVVETIGLILSPLFDETGGMLSGFIGSGSVLMNFYDEMQDVATDLLMMSLSKAQSFTVQAQQEQTLGACDLHRHACQRRNRQWGLASVTLPIW